MKKNMRQELTLNQVAQICGNNEIRILRVARNMGLVYDSWYMAVSQIRDELNASTADPAATLRHLLSQDLKRKI